MITILKYPEINVFEKHEAIVEIRSDYSYFRTFHKIYLRIFNSANVLLGTEIINCKEISNGQGQLGEPLNYAIAKFDISAYFKNSEKHFPNYSMFSTTGIVQTNLVKSYYCEVFETYGIDNIEHLNETLAYINVIPGGFSKLFKESYSGSTLEFLNRFLTWQPEKKISLDEFDFLYFYSYNSFNYIQPRIVLYFDDGTSQVLNLDPVSDNEYSIFSINCSFYANNLQNYETTDKKITKYEISILNEQGETIIEKRTFHVNHDYFNNRKKFMYKNSIGGFDLIEFKGVSENSNEISKAAGSFKGIEKTFSSKYSKMQTANSGWLQYSFVDAKRAKTYIIEFIKSTEAFEILDNSIIPITIKSDKIKVHQSDKFIYSVEIEYQHSIIDVGFFK